MTAGGGGGEVGLAVAVLRTIRRWNRADLARAMGAAESWLRQIELGERTPNPRSLERIATALRVPLSQLDDVGLLIRRVVRSGAAAAHRGEDHAAELAPATPAPLGDLLGVAFDLLAAAVRPLRQPAAESANWPAEEARRRAAALLPRLLGVPPDAQAALVREAAAFQSWALCELLCEDSVKAASHSPAAAAALAALALEVAAVVPGSEGWRLCVEAYVWAFLGNARRVADDLHGAEEAFARSAELWRAGRSGDLGLLDGSRLLDLEASLRQDQGRFQQALGLLDRALAAARGPRAGSVLLNKSKALVLLGDYDGAVAALRQAAPLLAEDGEPRQRLVLRFNLVVSLCHLGRAEEAEPLLAEVRELAEALGHDLDLVRLRWLEGLVAARLGRREDAESLLAGVRDDFRSRGHAYDAALAAAELAVLLADQGRTAEVKALVEQSLPIFQDLGIHRQARAALDALHRAAAREKLTATLARRVLHFLYRSQHDRQLRFEAAR